MKVFLCCDESGAKGSATQTESYPGEVGVLAGFIIPDDEFEVVRQAAESLAAAFGKQDAKLHIADLTPKEQCQLRDGVFSLLQRHDLACIYEAVHVQGFNDCFLRAKALLEKVKVRYRSRIKMSGHNHVNVPVLHHALFKGFYAKALAHIENEYGQIDDLVILSDAVDKSILRVLRKSGEELFDVGSLHVTKRTGWDPDKKEKVQSAISTQAFLPDEYKLENEGGLRTTFDISSVSHPLTLMADVVANSLLFHFKSRSGEAIGAPLSTREAIDDHPLAPLFVSLQNDPERNWFYDCIYMHPLKQAKEESEASEDEKVQLEESHIMKIQRTSSFEHQRWVRSLMAANRTMSVNLYSSGLPPHLTQSPTISFPDCPAVLSAKQELYGARLLPKNGTLPVAETLGKVHGVPAGRVFFANGASEVIFYMLASLCRPIPGTDFIPYSTVYLETPTYGAFRASLDMLGLRSKPLQRAARAGWIFELPDPLDHRCVVLVTNPHNPSGTRRDLTSLYLLVEAAEGMLIVDEVYRRTFERPQPSVSLLGSRAVAIDSLSKADGWGKLRFGWAASAEDGVIERAYAWRDASSLFVSAPVFLAASEVIKHPLFELPTPSAVQLLKANRRRLQIWIEEHKGFSWHEPEGGPIAFLELPKGVDGDLFVKNLEEGGVDVTPGRFFEHPSAIRLWLAGPPADLETGLAKIDAVWRSIVI